jgi:hypothetical protein
MINKKYISLLVIGLLAVGLVAVAAPILAQNDKGENDSNEQSQKPVVSGTVSAISGNTLTVTSKQESEDTHTTKTYTVDATNAKITKDGATIAVSGIAVGDRVSVQGTLTGTNVVATVIRDSQINKSKTFPEKTDPNVIGKVSAINGNILTVISKQGFNKAEPKTTVTLTVDATSAKLLRGNKVIALTDIAIGDNIIIQGTITGTNVVATVIHDGKVGNGKNDGDNNQALLQIEGNGQPIVAGTVSTITGSTITITNDKVTYTIDATNAKIIQGKNIILISGVKTGDNIIVQGTVNGTSVVASTIIDRVIAGSPKAKAGFFGSVGQFFRRLFGF